MRAHQQAARRLAAVLGTPAADVDDVVQEAFVRAHRSIGSYRADRSGFRTWLLAVVANQARNHHRSGSRRRRRELAVVGDRAPAPPPDAADQALAAERRRELLDAIRRLPTRQRDVVGCRYLLELSEAETAAVLDLAAGTVKSHLSRGLAHLRRELADG